MPATTRATLFLLLCLLLAMPLRSAAAEGRFALVIGNSAYTGGAPLKNPKNDAELIAQTLEGTGFEVDKQIDATQKQMRRAMLDFGRKLRDHPGSIGLFYYAGHGLQVRGLNYMVPVNADIKDEDEVGFEGIDMNDFLETMRNSQSRLNIVILDACRNNPYARSFRSANRGLAPVRAVSGTLIAYSTSPGDVAFDGNGLNSPYTLALTRFIKKPGLTIETVFKRVLAEVEDQTERKQTPWITGAFRGDFYFVAKGTQETADVSDDETKPASETDAELEKLFWTSIMNSSNPASYEAYLSAFPSGVFAPLAKQRIAELNEQNSSKVAEAEKQQEIVVAEVPKQDDRSNFFKKKLDGLIAALPGKSREEKSETITAARPRPTAIPASSGTKAELAPKQASGSEASYRWQFADSSTRELNEKEVKELNCHKLWLARNEIYHRNGFCFKTEKGIRYFDNSNCTTVRLRLNSTESRNVRTFRTWELRKNCLVTNIRG